MIIMKYIFQKYKKYQTKVFKKPNLCITIWRSNPGGWGLNEKWKCAINNVLEDLIFKNQAKQSYILILKERLGESRISPL